MCEVKRIVGNNLSNCCWRKLTCESVLAGGGDTMSKAKIPWGLQSDSEEEGASVLKFGLGGLFLPASKSKKLYGL